MPRRLVALALLASLLALAVLSVAPRARAEDAPDAAALDAAKKKADDAMIALHFEDALVDYKRVYEATKNPAILYNMGHAYEGLGDFPKALDAYEEFSDKAPAELKARVPKLAELLTDVRNRVATLVVSSPVEGAEIRVGDKVVGKTRIGQVVLRVNAGRQPIAVTRAGYFAFEKTVDLTAGTVQTLDARLASQNESAVLVVRSPVSGAAVTVDGKAVGTVPAEAFVGVGMHTVALRRDGYEPAEKSVVVGAGDKRNVDVPLVAKETIASKWWFWTAIGAVVVAGGISAFVIATTERDPDMGTIPPRTVATELRLGTF